MKKLFLLTLSLLFLSGCSLIGNNDTQNTWDESLSWQVKTNTTEQSGSQEYWLIWWSLSYPSDWIPEKMEVCAENSVTKQVDCTNQHIKSTTYTYGEWYTLKLPYWTYTVFAKTPEMNGYKAYYSAFVTCWLLASCPSHTPIPVTLSAGNTTLTQIDPIDWYK